MQILKATHETSLTHKLLKDGKNKKLKQKAKARLHKMTDKS